MGLSAADTASLGGGAEAGQANPLLGLPNALLTPHTAGYSEDSMADDRRQSVDKVVSFLQGEWPDSVVNLEAKARARAPAGTLARN
jgi:phosphoglycerate dehydrogenase-like enzyme